VAEHQHVGVGVQPGHPGIPARRPAGFVDDRESQSAEGDVGTFGQPRPQFVAVVVTPAGDEAIRVGLK